MPTGISLLTLIPGVNGGTETYARALMRSFASSGGDEVALLPSIAARASEGLRAAVIDAYRADREMRGRLAAMARANLHPGPVRRQVMASGVDVVHFPLEVMIPTLPDLPTVTTIHDVQHYRFPHFYPPHWRLYLDRVYRRAVARSERIITISEFSRREIIQHLDIDPSRIDVISFGVDHAVFHPGADPKEDIIIYPAHRHPHKNHARLFQAMEILRCMHPGLRLVLTGHGHDGHHVPDGVEVLGRIPTPDLAALYRRARCMVFPSENEGFGLPILEAMASGCPVACANTTALPEAAGGAAELFDPYRPESIAHAVDRVLTRPEPYVALGLSHAAQFTWDACADQHRAIYARARR